MNEDAFDFIVSVIGKAQTQSLSSHHYALLEQAIENAELDYERHGDRLLTDNGYDSIEDVCRAYVEGCYESIKQGEFD